MREILLGVRQVSIEKEMTREVGGVDLRMMPPMPAVAVAVRFAGRADVTAV